MKEKFEKAVAEYVNVFCRKHDLQFNYWVGDNVGTIAECSDYYFNFNDIRLDIDTKQPKGKIFDWYDSSLKENEDKNVNYYVYCMATKNGKS